MALADVEDLDLAGAAGAWGGEGAAAELRRGLLAWYAGARRRLPWRGDAPPWSVDKVAHRRTADVEAEKQAQPRISSFFTQNLRAAHEATPVVDLEVDDVDAQDESGVPVADDARNAEAAFAPSAYGTWVSEVMLQQTQVERVVDYWTRWMRQFPTVRALAQAEPDAVNAAWAGLGYYGRARRLHEGAKHVVAQHGGEVPCDHEALLRIPGVGPYTAGAIASIAFGRRAAVVDGNVIRVFARLRALEGDAASPALVRRCWTLAEALVEPDQPGTFNQALMELGATVCTPKAPACGRCPVQASCRAASLVSAGKVPSVMSFPEKAVKKPPKLRRFAVAVVEASDGRVLLIRRPETGLLAGQWECPSALLEESAAMHDDAANKAESAPLLPAQARVAEAALTALLAVLGVLPGPGPGCRELAAAGVPPVLHAFSHERHTMHLYRISVLTTATTSSTAAAADAGGRPKQWMTPAEAEAAGITSGVRKIFSALGLSAASMPTTPASGRLARAARAARAGAEGAPATPASKRRRPST